MPTEPDPDQTGGSYDPTRAHDPVEPTRVHEPVDTALAQGAGPAAGMGATDRTGTLGDRPPRDGRRDGDASKAGWLWALLAAVLVGIVVYALVQQGDDDVSTGDQVETDVGAVDPVPDDTAVEETTTETVAPEDTATTGTTAVTPAPVVTGGEAGDPGADDDPGTVTTADGTDLFTLVQGDAGDADRLAPYVGEDITGEGAYVLEVMDGEGFWIGTDEQRIFAATSDETTVEVGQRVDFAGTLEASSAEDSDRDGDQGHFIELRSLTPV